MSEKLSRPQLIAIAEEYGTPLYIYHAEKIEERYHQLQQAFTELPVKIFYASKALTNISILQYIRGLGANADCSSINEVKLSLKAGFLRNQILYTSNGIAFEEIVEAHDLGVSINIDSLSNLEKFGKKFGHSYPVGIRLRPNILAGGNLQISTGHDKSKFGIPVDEVDQLLKVVRENNLHIKGLHIHTGSGVSDLNVWMKVVNVMSTFVPHFPELEFLDLGGGFKIPYREGDKETDMVALASALKEAVSPLRTTGGKELEIWIEPGKYLVSEAGYFVSRVNVLKETSTVNFAGVDSGFNHLIRPMFYGAYHHIENLSHPEGKIKPYAVVGNICETDTFAWDRKLPEIREEDLLLFHNAGAYGFEMASNFNSRFRPAEVLVKNGESRLIRKRENLDDLLRNQLFS